MWLKTPDQCPEILAGDGSFLREIFNPRHEPLSLRYSLAWARVPEGGDTRPHRLASSEVYVVLEGQGEMHIDDERSAVGPGAVVYIPPGSRQWIRNSGRGELRFLCLVDPAWRPEDEKIL